jgi:hypothetical protein
MKDSLKLMNIYRQYLEMTDGLLEILERRCKTIEENNISEKLKEKYQEYRKHVHKFTETWNDDLHMLLRLDNELKEIEDLEKREKK